MQKTYFAIFISILVVVASARLLLSLGRSQKPVFPPSGPIKFEATLKSEPKIYDIGQVLAVENLKIYADLFPKYHEGERVSVTGQITDGKIFQPQIETLRQSSGFAKFRSGLREKISQSVNSLLPQREATLVLGSTLGIDSIDKNFRDQLIKTGTIHVVVVSGQNLMIVATVILSTARFAGRRKSLIFAVFAVLFYAFLTGFEPPVVRACLMVLVATLATFLGRQADTLLSLFLAAVVIVLVWPQALFEISFQLTFAATLGIVTLGSRIGDLLGESGKWGILGNNAAIATSAYIFTAPVILYYFGQVSALSPFANVLVAEAVAPIMALGFSVALASFIFMPIAQILAYLAFVPAFYFSKVVALFASWPFGQMNIGKGNIWFVLIYYSTLFFLMIFWKRKVSEKAKPLPDW